MRRQSLADSECPPIAVILSAAKDPVEQRVIAHGEEDMTHRIGGSGLPAMSVGISTGSFAALRMTSGFDATVSR